MNNDTMILQWVKKRKISNQPHVSNIDADATLVSRKTNYNKLCYKVHSTIDQKYRIIVDCYVTTGACNECKIFTGRVNYLLNKFKYNISEWIADKGYVRGETYKLLFAKHTRAYIPLHDPRSDEGKISKGEVVFDRKKDRYICPAGNYLYPYEKLDHRKIKRYRVLNKECSNCPLKAACLPANYSQRSRFIYRNPLQDYLNAIKIRQDSKHFKSKLKYRKWAIDGIFAEAKNLHCLSRAIYRSVVKVQIQCYLIAIVQNIKRLLKIILIKFYFFNKP
jgi:hypothetical protein